MPIIEEVGKIEKTAPDTIEWTITKLGSYSYCTLKSLIFCVADASWCLALSFDLVNCINPDYWQIELRRRSKMPGCYSVAYNFGWKNKIGVERLGRGIMSENDQISKKFWLKHGHRTPIIIRCTVRRQITHSNQPKAMEETRQMKLISLDRFSEKFKNLFSIKETCDTTLKVQDKEYKAHRVVLIAQSPVFAAMFMHDTAERQTGVINIPDCDPDSFQAFLEYLYSGKLEEISSSSALHLYVTSDKYEVPELKAFCVKYLKHCLTVENICEIVVFAEKYHEAKLHAAVQDFFNKNVSEIIETPEWESLLMMEFRLANKLLKSKYRK